jgi:hypothetical protein
MNAWQRERPGHYRKGIWTIVAIVKHSACGNGNYGWNVLWNDKRTTSVFSTLREAKAAVDAGRVELS